MSDFGDVLKRVRQQALTVASPPPVPAMPEDRARMISATPMSPPLLAALRVVDGPLVRVDLPHPKAATNPAWKDVTEPHWRRPGLPPVAPDVKQEIAARIEALRVLLQPAPQQVVIRWLIKLASQMECKLEGEALADHVQSVSKDLDLPTLCFTPESRAEVRDRTGPWFPSLAKLLPVLRDVVKPLGDELRRLEELRELIINTPPPALMAPDGPTLRAEGEVVAWLEAMEAAAADGSHDPLRASKARAFRGRLKAQDPALAARFKDRLDALCGAAPESRRTHDTDPDGLPLAPSRERSEQIRQEVLEVVPDLTTLRRMVRTGTKLREFTDAELAEMSAAARARVVLEGES